MDVGLAASITTSIDACTEAAQYLQDVKDAPDAWQKLAVEVTRLLSLLAELQHQVEEAKATQPWVQAVRILAVEHGLLDQTRRIMEDLARKLRPIGKLRVSMRDLVWTLDSGEADYMLSEIARIRKQIGLFLQKAPLALPLRTDERLIGVDGKVLEIADDVSADLKENVFTGLRRLILEWISPLDFHPAHYTALSRTQSDTGKWFLESEQFNQWFQGETKALWCPGPPGTGKTVIAATVIYHLQMNYASMNTGIAYIYCNYKEQTKQTSVNLIGGLLQQLALQNSSVLDNLASIYKLHSFNNTRPTFHELSKVFQSIITSFTNVFIVIDALDECCEENGSRDELLECLGALADNARLLLTSRPNVHIEERFPDMEKLEIVASDDEDIRNYLDARISQTPKLVRLIRSTPALRDRIVESILEKAKGVPLLAQLHMNSLSNKNRQKAVLKALRDLPSTIVEAYDEAFKRIEAQKKDDRQLAMMAIYLITLTEAPLTVRELQHALAANPGASRIEEGDILDEKTLLTVCGGLIHIERKTNTVRLIHASTADYIRSIPKDRYSDFQIEMYQRALEAYERVVGPENASILASILKEINSLGLLYSYQGKLAKAEEMLQRALKGYERALGPDHPSALDAMKDLGKLYSDQGRLTKAEEMLQRALKGYERALGPDDPSALNVIRNLGLLYSNQGKLAEAEEMLQRALKGYERALGPDHPSALDAMKDLGKLYSYQGKLQEAEAMLQRALKGYERALGPDHLSALDAMKDLGKLYSYQGKLQEAEAMLQRALKGYERALDPDHLSALDVMKDLGKLYSDQGRLAEVEEMLQRALKGYERALGPDHPSALNVIRNLGLLYSNQGKLAEAEEMLQRALKGYDRALGPDHPLALNAMKDLDDLYSGQGKLAKTGEMYQRALTGYGKAFSPNHTLTIDVDNKLGTLYADQDKLAKAQLIKRRATYSGEEFTTSQDLTDSALEGASVRAGSDLDDHSSTLEAGPVRAGSDSGYGSMTHDELSLATIPSRALVFDSMGRDDLEVPHETQEYSEDEEVRSVFSNQEDIKSQILMKKTQEEMIAEDSLGVLLAQNKKLTPFYKEALTRIGKARFIRNFRKLLKQYYLDLLREAKTNLEQATVHLLRSNATRKRIAQIVVNTITPEHEEARLKMERFVQDTKRKEPDIEGWIVRNRGFTPPTDLFVPPTWENANLENSSSEEDSDSENDRKSSILPNVAGAEAFLIGGTSFQALSINLGLFLLPDVLDPLTRGIMSIPRNRIWFSIKDDVSLLNRMKSFMEDLTEESWNWWPLRPSMRRLKKDQIRLHWQCHCGQYLWSELSTRNARLYQLVLEQRGDISQYPHLCRMRRYKTSNVNLLSSILQTAGFASSANHPSQSSGSPAADSPQKSQTKGAKGATPTKNTLPSPQRPSSDDPADEKSIEMPSIPQLFVLFGVKGTRRTIDLAQIDVKEDDEDSVFFCNLQRKYREYRGYWRYWFSVWQLTHCNFIKFKKIRANRLINAGEEIPTDSQYVYNPRAPQARCPPITRHEFELALRPCSTPCMFSSFHDCLEPPIGKSAIDRIPKRKSALELRTSRMELAWGLHAQHDISAIRLVVYHFFICAGPLAVWIWWQTVRPTDPQNAVVPLTTVGLFLSVFWSAAGVLKFRDSS